MCGRVRVGQSGDGRQVVISGAGVVAQQGRGSGTRSNLFALIGGSPRYIGMRQSDAWTSAGMHNLNRCSQKIQRQQQPTCVCFLLKYSTST